MHIEAIFNVLSFEAWATITIGILAAFIAVTQISRTLKLNKKNEVFNKVSERLNKVEELFDKLEKDKQKLVDELAKAANYFSNHDNSSMSQEDYNQAIETINRVYESKREHIDSIYTTHIEILNIIKEIEKSTLIGEKVKGMSRILFYRINEHFILINKVNDVLNSFGVIPSPGEKLSIAPETFNKFIDLLNLIFSENDQFKNYLNDLEVAIHNDLVSKIFGNAKNYSIPQTHLTQTGIDDLRRNNSIL